ncbi:hypothetical protein M569_02047 [Genlisea aurea]|uniref:Uncharacterized protein n=1 Tax=Genlisea aurea TaxID=192259 RepID=S8D070_9LAMI|nr:hypothetical protein M569_02047 [Genlisea aurea]
MDFRDINDSAKDVKLEAGELKVEPRDFQQTVNSVKYDNRTEDCNKVDALKEGLQIEGRELGEAREAMGENRVEIKGDDKQRDKDRRRKEVKHWDLGERDKERNDRRNNLQPANLVVEIKDVLREERDSERSGNDRKELQKDKEKLNEKEKDHVKAEPWNASDREASHSEKEIGDIPAKCFELEKSTLEPKKKDSDMPKNIDREVRDKKKERETDVEPERSEKRGKFHEKESDDGDLHVEGSLEREREIFNSGVAQRKRMLRPRSSPQRGNRDSRFRPGSNEIDG